MKEKELFDAYLELSKFYIGQYNERRKYEISTSLVIWTTLAGIGYYIVDKNEKIQSYNYSSITPFIIVCLLIALHWYFINGLYKSNTRDTLKAHFYLDKIKAINPEFDFKNMLRNVEIMLDKKEQLQNYLGKKNHNESEESERKKNPPAYFYQCWSWAQYSQFLVTVLLCCIILALSINNNPKPIQNISTTNAIHQLK